MRVLSFQGAGWGGISGVAIMGAIQEMQSDIWGREIAAGGQD
jgi:hypothetical protein